MTVNGRIFKKGKKEDPGNYKPVSLPSMTGKVMEKNVLAGIEKHLKHNAVIGHSQHGFMSSKSCLSNLIFFYDKVTHQDDEGNPVDIIFVDFGEAVILSLTGSYWTKSPAHN
ncbi:rna-directed dna polymerase from mobile element jockey-like [Willisornis vidua]|uniref:Rna-directed dna polymerase from mobile element jockey-like n=1 Tax=Willisornis vidua TaxID=1566151 RepID=A0ABQ9DDY6_9PASS|nr:rna-directed dna polymerase from mobile element jockey-like [Willisornis vidua]KAJ7428109.1 rna-directed dna polymerase from mobile element jockey-like [Willisornis vidua]